MSVFGLVRLVRAVRLCGLVAGLSVASHAAAQNFNETESNNPKSEANALTFTTSGDGTIGTITGSSTGTSVTSGAGLSSADTFRVTMPAAGLGIYAYTARVLPAAGGTGSYTLSIRGLNQTAGGIGTTDNAVASSSSSSNDRVQWYGFGKGEQLYLRVTGSSSNTGNYVVTITRRTITPISSGAVLNSGTITVTTDGQGHTSNTDLWVYNSNLDPEAGFGNDDIVASTNTRSTASGTLAAGTYYVAISNQNLANNLASPAADGNKTQNVLDFNKAVANSSTSAGVNISLSISDTSTSVPVTLLKPNVFDVQFVRFDVAPAPRISVVPGSNQSLAAPGADIVFTLAVDSTPNSVTAASIGLVSLGGPASLAMLDDGDTVNSGDVTAGDGVYSGKFAAPAVTLGGRFPVTYSVSDSGGRTAVGAFSQDVAPSNDLCSGAIELSESTVLGGTTIIVNNYFASTDSVATACAPNGAPGTPNGVWFSYHPTTNQVLSFEEFGNQSVVFAQFGSCADVSETRCGDSGSQSNNFQLTGGTTYYFLVGRDSTTATTNVHDNYVIHARAAAAPAAPANDLCENATNITASTFPITTTVIVGGATPDVNSTCNTSAQVDSPNGIWYTYTPAIDSVLQIKETDPDTFGRFTVFTGCGSAEYACRLLGQGTPNSIPLHSGQQYWILISRDIQGPAGADFDLVIDVIPNPIPNRACESAIEITGAPFTDGPRTNGYSFDGPGVACVNNAGARARNAIWYRITPAKSIAINFRETQSQDAAIVIFSGSCDALTPYWCNFQSPLTDVTTRARLDAGQTYYFMVFRETNSDPSETDALGFLVQEMSTLPPVPPNDLCSNAKLITSPSYSETVFIAGATSDVKTNCSQGTQSVATTNGVWYQYTNGSNATTASVWTNEPDRFPASNQVAVYAGSCPSGDLTEIVCDQDATAVEALTFNMDPNTTYYILLGASAVPQANADEVIVFNFRATPSPLPSVANGECSMAKSISSLPYSDFTWSFNAPNDATDIACNSGTGMNNAVWYSYTATANGYAVFSEEGPQDAAIAVFDSCPAVSGTEIRCASFDDVGIVPMSMGQTYYFVCARYNAATSSATSDFWDFRFSFVGDATNDTCATAKAIPSFPYFDTVPIANLTDDAIALTNGCSGASPQRRGVWYTFTARDSEVVMVEELGPQTGSRRFAIYSGTCGSLVQGGCSTNFITGNDFDTASPVIMQVLAGQTYYILVASGAASVTNINQQFYDIAIYTFGSDVGRCSTGATCQLVTHQNCTGVFTPGIGPCKSDFNCTGGTSVQDIFDFLGAWFANNIAADFNGSGAVTVQDIFDFLAAWFSGC